jgi:uncharacterized membrane protein
MNNKLVKVNWVLSALITIIAIYGYFIVINYAIKFGKNGYYEGLEGYLFILIFTSPILIFQFILSVVLILKKIKIKQVQLSLLPLVFATIIPFGSALFIS